MAKNVTKKTWLKRILPCVMAGILVIAVPWKNNIQTVQAKEPIVVVIDPGHGGVGGTNEGTKTGPYLEKTMTLLTAQAMKNTLEQFEGVKVYLTRESDREVSLQQRADIAKAYDADFFFSIHYNSIGTHDRYGTEVWTSAFGDCYAKGQTFGSLYLEEMQSAYQILPRGVKVRIGATGKDYYGVIRACTAYGIPSVIMEHCFVDNANDAALISNPEKIAALGVTDALAAAKYLKLKSATLGIDYTNVSYPVSGAPAGGKALPDVTGPEWVTASLLGYDDGQKMASFSLKSCDSQSALLYYSYSTDGGATFSSNIPWTNQSLAGSGSQGEMRITIPVSSGTNVIFRVSNQYDLTALSNAVTVS